MPPWSEAASSPDAIVLSGGFPLPPSLIQIWQLKHLCDVEVRVEGQAFPAHRLVLAAGSDYFAALLCRERFCDSAAGVIELPEMTAAVFGAVLNFLYAGYCSILNEHTQICILLQAAARLQVSCLQTAAMEALIDQLSPLNCIRMWAFGEDHSMPALEAAARQVALRDFDDVVALDAFQDAPLAHIQSLLADDCVGAKHEELVYEAALRWLRRRESQLDEELVILVFSLVRFPLIDPLYLKEHVLSEPLLQGAAMRVLAEALVRHQVGPRARRRTSSRVMYAIGGKDNDGHTLSSVEVYDPITRGWEAAPPMATGRCGAVAAFLDGKVYVAGGHGEDEFALSSVEVFDATLGIWEAAPSMNTARNGAAAGVLEGKLYVAGGDDEDSTTLSSVEVYDPALRVWSPAAAMKTPRCDAAAAVLDDKLYMAGGDGNVEVYDSLTGMWETVPAMSSARSGAVAAAMDGKVYMAGGVDEDGTTLRSMEVYDPLSRRWEPALSMGTPRSAAVASVVDGKLYVAGGDDEDSNKLRSVDVYDPLTKLWTVAPAMSTERFGPALF